MTQAPTERLPGQDCWGSVVLRSGDDHRDVARGVLRQGDEVASRDGWVSMHHGNRGITPVGLALGEGQVSESEGVMSELTLQGLLDVDGWSPLMRR